MKELTLNIGENEYIAKFDNEDYSNVSINGTPHKVEILRRFSGKIYSIAVDNKLFNAELSFGENGRMVVASHGFFYEFDVSDETRKMLKEFIKSAGVAGTSGLTQIKAPMPGMVVKCLKQPGDKINKGDKIIIIEAMKMENSLASPVSGTISSYMSKEGEAVQKDAVLLEIDAE